MTINRSRNNLPSTWDTPPPPGPDDKVCLQVNGLKVKYIGSTTSEPYRSLRCATFENRFCAGPGDEDKDAASVRADRSIPSDVSLYYYEVLIVNKGRDGFVGKLQVHCASLRRLFFSTERCYLQCTTLPLRCQRRQASCSCRISNKQHS